MTAVQLLVEDLAERLGRDVMVDDERWRMRAYSAPREAPDRLRLTSILTREVPADAQRWASTLGLERAEAPVRTPANSAVGAEPRLVIPLRHVGRHLGYLTLVDRGQDLSKAGMHIATETAMAIAAQLHASRSETVDERESALLADLVGPDESLRAEAVRALGCGLLDRRARVCLLFVRHTPAGRGDGGVPAARRGMPPRTTLTRLGRSGTLMLAAADTDGELDKLAERLIRDVAATAVGVSAPVEKFTDAPSAAAQAEHCARVALSDCRFDGIANWQSIGPYRLLLHLPSERERIAELLDPAFVRLLAADRRKVLVRTLETYLDAGGDATAAAGALVLHRAGLHYRLRRIEELVGVDLRDGAVRLALHMSIKSARLAEAAL